MRTRLIWDGPDVGPVLRLAGPSRATLRDLEVNGSRRADGIVVGNCDQPGSRVYLEQLNVDAARRVGLVVDGVEVADVELRNMNHGGCDLGVRVRGGATPIPDLGEADPEFIRMMMASTRVERPHPLAPVPPGATDVRFFRVVSTQGRDCLRLTAD